MNIPDELLMKLQSGAITLEECKKELATKKIQYKVTEKGCVGFYGVRKFPIVLYKDELHNILETVLASGWNYSTAFAEFLTNKDLSTKAPKDVKN